jgi:hypothetical protein
LSLLALACACSGKDPYNPGSPLGTFHVQGQLMTNSCGDGNGAPNPWLFDVKLARDASTLYWIQGGAPVSGMLDAKLHSTMQTTTTTTVHQANPQTGVPFCALQRDDSLDATLTGDPPNGFTGSLSYAFSQTSGSDCSDQLAAGGGTFAALPCATSYNLMGTRK